MGINRRQFIEGGGAAAAALTATSGASAAARPGKLRRIAVEEAWSIPEHLDAMKTLTDSNWDNLDIINTRDLANTVGTDPATSLGGKLMDTRVRLAEMDRLGIDMQVLSLTSPGVQMFDTDKAVTLVKFANDRLAEVVKAHPTRFGGLASFAPQEPKAAAKEMERAINVLGLNGFMVNSHTNNEYLDEEKFWPILEAAEALGRPIYIHPRCPSDGMAAPFRDHRLRAAIWGYQAETGTHAMRLILSGVFDRFPKLQIVIGHMGENVPFHLWRSDHWYHRRRQVYRSSLSPSEVMRRNFHITTSGVEHAPALRYAIEVLGADRVLWAIDYPYEVMEPSVRFMNEVKIPEAERLAVYGGNAARIFHIAGT